MNWRKPIIFALLKITGSKIPSILKEIEQIDNSSKKEIEAYQKDKLEKILLHAWQNVPYYTRVLEKAKVVVNGKINLENFDKIPILTKDIIRKEGKNLYSKDYKERGFYENTSGGSTGEPVRFIQDKEYEAWNYANKIYIKLKAGQDFGERELRLWGSERDLILGKEKPKIQLRNWLYNRKEFNAFKMSKEDMHRFIDEWNKFNPTWVEAYVQPIFEFSKFIELNACKINSPKNGVLTSAGTLYPEMKEKIEKVMNCKVYNRYGSREVGDMACSKGGANLYLSPWNHYLEILNKKLIPCANKKIGKIYVTTLNNYSMPLIRYDIGDFAENSYEKYEINQVLGREMSVFKTKEGKIIPAEFFIHFIGVVYNKDFISKFQVIQKDYKLIEIKVIVKDQKGFNQSKIKIEDSIKKVMGKDCKINWTIVKEIKPTKSGKYLYTVCEIK